MQTKQQIRQLLASAGLTPNKRRGQNFLIDLNLIRLLIDSANITPDDVVLEVGTGTGSLTQELAQKAARVIAVEIEQTLTQITKTQLAEAENVELINADILESKNTIDRTVINALEQAVKKHPGRFLLVANLPYSIACPTMLNLTTGPIVADAMYVTVQKEVARRMTAQPDNKHYGPLTILLTATGEVKTIRVLKPSVFWPPPQVDSAMISFIRNSEKASRIHNSRIFSQVVNLFMGHRRKMLKGCVKLASDRLAEIHTWPAIFEDCCIDPHKRPDQLSAENYIAIANLCCEYLNR